MPCTPAGRRRPDPPRVADHRQELNEFLGLASGHRLGAFYRLAAYTGARRGELLHLRWADVNPEASEVTFSGSTAVIDGQRVEGTTKGGRSRVVSLDSGSANDGRASL